MIGIQPDDLLLLNDGAYLIIDSVNNVDQTVYIRYNNYKGTTKEKMSNIADGLQRGQFMIYRKIKLDKL